MTTVIDVIDTAVKIGFGAIISGIATYVITNKNNAHEVKKGIATDKKEILMKLVINLDSAFSKRNSAIQSIWRKYKANNKDLEDDYVALTKAANECKLAITYAYLIDKEDIANLISEIFSSFESERLAIEMGERSEEFLDNHSDKRTNLLNEVRTMLPELLENIHA